MPFPAPGVFTAIATASRVAYWIYEQGFKQQFAHDEDYTQLVRAVREFDVALKRIDEVYQYAEQHVASSQVVRPTSDGRDLESFKTIVGDFNTTLKDCRDLLEEKASFARRNEGMFSQARWNFSAADEVKSLRQRIQFHHIRLSQTLQPLQISLMLSIKETIQSGFDRVQLDVGVLQQMLFDIQAHLGMNPAEPVPSTAETVAHLPSIPDYLQGCFETQARAERDLPVNDEVRISSVMGHVDDKTSSERVMANPTQADMVQRYVDLMKAAWILEMPTEAITDPNGTSSSLNAVLWRDLRAGVAQKLSAFGEHGVFRKPSTADIRATASLNFVLWIFPPRSRVTKPKLIQPSEILLLEVPLRATHAGEAQQMIVAGSTTRRQYLRVQANFVDSIGRLRDSNTYNVNTENAVLLPTYASPGAQNFTVQLRASADDQLDTAFEFDKLEDLFQFQRCLTGYEVRHDQDKVVEVKYKHGGLKVVRRTKSLCTDRDVARAQIWYHRPLLEQKKMALSSPTSMESRDSSENTSPTPRPRQRSVTTSGRSQSQSIDEWTRLNAPSFYSYNQQGSAQNVAAEIPMLEEPKVVIMMAIHRDDDTNTPREVRTLRLLTFSLRGTYIDPTSCDCRDESLACPRLVIKSWSAMRARLYDYESNLNQWSLTALGQFKGRKPDRFREKLEDLSHVVITFSNAGERARFAQQVEDARDLYEARKGQLDNTKRIVEQKELVR